MREGEDAPAHDEKLLIQRRFPEAVDLLPPLAATLAHLGIRGRNRAVERRSKVVTEPAPTSRPVLPQYDAVLRSDVSQVIPGPSQNPGRPVR